MTPPLAITENHPMPVELLRDGRGVYGIGASELFDFEAAPIPLILRPDRFMDTKRYHASWHTPVLQKIVTGLHPSPFMHSREEQLRNVIHHEALKRAGLPPDFNERWWSTEKKQQARNRSVYHGLRCLSVQVINELVGKALQEAADADAVKVARRFTFRHRERIYRAAALSRRALQLAEIFPVLAIAIYSNHSVLRAADFSNRHAWWSELADRERTARHLVNRGARLRDVAAVMDVPMALRQIKPGAAHLASDVLCHPEFLNFLPNTTMRQRIWLTIVNWACGCVDPDFGAWTARHVPEIAGRAREVWAFVDGITEWVRAGKLGPALPGDPAHPRAGHEFIVRPFTPSMSIETVTRLNAEWHDAIAANKDGPDAAFPPPWYPAAKAGEFDILPIENSAELYREGAAMHHCIGTYVQRVRSGGWYVYSVRHADKRIATFALQRCALSAELSQIRGPCNAQVSKKIVAAVMRWLRAQPRP
jgi:hypothetical protein